jgi:hypothetical protein
MLFRLWELVDHLSTQVLLPFVSRFDGGITGVLESLRSNNGGERR